MPDLPPHVPNDTPKKGKPRLSPSKRGYGRAWEKVRKIMLEKHPVCLICDSAFSVDVHHCNNNPKDNREENLAPLCHSCHSKLTNS